MLLYKAEQQYKINITVASFKDPVLSVMLHVPLNNRSLASVQTKTITEVREVYWTILGL